MRLLSSRRQIDNSIHFVSLMVRHSFARYFAAIAALLGFSFFAEA